MDQYIVSARKYRPTNFSSVVGQQSLTATLKNAIATDRLAHAYLFCGGRGVGKTSCARIFAKTINCTSRTANGEACDACDSCRQFNEGRSLNILELDAASHNGVDDIKSLIEQVMVPPAVGRYRVFIIDEVHMLSTSAFNAFLKTLEEPPAHAVFILATTEKHKILPTILSRCQVYDFNRIGIADMVAHLGSVAHSEGIEADPAALAVIARKADGAMRDALSIFDQVAACTQGRITYRATIENLNVLDRGVYNRLLDAFLAQDIASALLIYKEIRDKGFDSQFFISGLGQYMRDLMVAAMPATASLLEAPEDERAQLAERAAKLHPTFIYRAMELCNDADFNFRTATNKQFLVELTLIRLCQLCSPLSGTEGGDGGQLKPLKAAAPEVASTAPRQTAPASAPQLVQPAAAPQQAHNTAPQPAHTAASETPAAPHSAARPTVTLGGLSLRMATKTAPKHEAQIPEPRSVAFGEERLREAWRSLTDKLPGEPFLNSIITETVPTGLQGTGFSITTSSEMHASMLKEHKGTIIKLLADELQNDSIDFTITVNDSGLNPMYWPEQRVLDYMLEHHPSLSELIAKYHMRLI